MVEARLMFDEMPERDVFVWTMMVSVNMYAKYGSLNKSLLVFFKLRGKNLFCWNSIIEGLSVHGYAEEALAICIGINTKHANCAKLCYLGCFTKRLNNSGYYTLLVNMYAESNQWKEVA
ncbi:hypothetical protein HYC85_025862 [Camellia sinensis]|uniref:Pentatricopeptide repeat-containing protein n=1 Tax=Camellia sinensis TaxID=4442 RepID=A0A7J7G1Y5_CAMSI|nr:hypothetical protein HYC85_025862 [Camellia sinensis]